MRKLIERCPGCGGDLVVSRMSCTTCATSVEGQFQPSAFDRLSPESLAFVELFVRRKGNMKEMERELGLPYSTVRHRLDEVVRELGSPATSTARAKAPPAAPVPPVPPATPTPPDAGAAARRRDILGRLDRGEISPDEAVQLLGESR
jgi:hypothetical protein